jgi:MoaA/NifB/PqqE/SkfB family radical SAM enzyme
MSKSKKATPSPRALLAAPVTYNYYVTYTFDNPKTKGSGWIGIVLGKPLASIKAVMEVTEFIRKEKGFDSVIITNWILL